MQSKQTVIHVYGSDPKSFYENSKHVKIYPPVSFQFEDDISPTRIVMISDCFHKPIPSTLTNPLIVIHVPHSCMEELQISK